MSAADQTIIVASYGKIGSDLKALNLTNWIATSYFLSLTSFQPLYGRLSDIFGRKACLLFGYTVFGLGCVFCGLARNINELIAARVCYLTLHNTRMPFPQVLIIVADFPGYWRWRDDDGRKHTYERYNSSARPWCLARHH